MELVKILGSFTPCVVCLNWLIVFQLNRRRNDLAKWMLTVFLATCTLLYFCHGLYYNVGLSVGMEALWTLCSLSVYPLYYIYIMCLTGNRLSLPLLLTMLMPGVMVALAKLVRPEEHVDTARQLLFMIQVPSVAFFGMKRLVAFDRLLANVYANTEDKDLTPVRQLLVAFIATSCLSAIANAIGKRFFAENVWAMLVIMAPFAIMLFVLSYIGYHRNFSVEQLEADCMDEPEEKDGCECSDSLNGLAERIDCLMNGQSLYLRKYLKIGDLEK